MLLSYAKIALQHDLLESSVPDAPGLEPWLTGYFPSALRERFAGDIDKHSLRREIIALGLTNAVVNRGGPAMAVRLAEETQRTTADVANAFLAAREVFELPALWLRIDALDGKAKGAAQLALYQATQDLVNAQTLWFLRNGRAMSDLPGTIARHRAGVAELKAALAAVLPARRQAVLEAEQTRLAGVGIPPDLGADVAALDILGLAPPITEIAEQTKTPVAEVARTYLAIGDELAHRRPRRQGRRHRHARLLRPPRRRPGAEPAGRRASRLHPRRHPQPAMPTARTAGSPGRATGSAASGPCWRRSPARAR